MTPDDPRDPRPDATGPQPSPDELASALLDGELSDDEAAAARARPDVMAWAGAMEEARRALRELPVPPHAGRDRAVAAALAAFDDQRADDGETSAAVGAGGRREAGGHRSRDPVAPPTARGASTRRAQRWLAAAAAAAVLAGLAGLAVATGDDRTDQDAAGYAADEAAEGDDGDSQAGGSAAEGGEAPDRAEAEEAPMATADTELTDELAAADAGDLGAFPSADALVDHLAALLAEGGDEGRVPPMDGDDGAGTAFRQACVDDPPAPLAAALATVLGGRAVVYGRLVDVWVIDTVEGRRVVALDDSCSPVVDRPLG